MPKHKLSQLDQLMRKVSMEPPSGGGIWLGVLDTCGYARVRSKGKLQSAHRMSYEICIGKIPEGLELDHKCRVRCCINPRHLEPVTHPENMRRGISNSLPGRLAALRTRSVATHCKKGHRWSEENTYTYRYPSGRVARLCRACHRFRGKEYKKKIKHMASPPSASEPCSTSDRANSNWSNTVQ